MAIIQTLEMKGTQPIPNADEVGELYEITFKIDTAVTNLGIGDFVQLMQIPADFVLSDIRLGASATLGATTVAAGIADALATTTLSTTFIAAQTFTTTAPVLANSLVMADLPIGNPTKDQRILALAIAAEAEATNVIYCSVRYRCSRYGK